MTALRRLRRHPLATVSAAYLALLVVCALFAPLLAPLNPDATDLDHVLSGPTSSHLLGTDALGRDVLSRLMYGGRASLGDAAIAMVTVLVIAVGSGLAAGFLGGRVDRVFTWIVDVMLAVPIIVTLLVVVAAVGDSRTAATIALGVLVSPGLARIVRGSTLAVRGELYVVAARVSGLSKRDIALRHVLPRLLGPIVVQTSLLAGGALLIDAGLSYLGLGAQPPTPTWGNMIADAAAVINRQSWLLVPPGAVLGLAILAFGLLGDAIRDADSTRRAPATRRRRTTPPPAEPSEPRGLLSLRKVSIAIPGPAEPTTVVRDVSLYIDAGETVGLVGESGCGKSVTGRAIFDLIPGDGAITAGSIVFDGTDLTTADRQKVRRLRGSGIAMISQDPIAALDPTFTAGHQVDELVRRHHGGSREEVRARTLELLRGVEFADPEDVARRYPHQLSGGMAQRVAIAMALAGEPRLLIADEPTTALDVSVQADVLRLLHRLQTERGMAMLLISHDWGVIARTCQRAYVMYAGQVVESATTPDLLEASAHPYTVGLLASMPSRARPGEHLAAIPGTVPQPSAWPHGCHFEPRCPLATADCAAGQIPLLDITATHHSRCIHHTMIDEGGDHERAAAGRQ